MMAPMLAFVARRILQSLLVMTAVSLVAFALFRFVGDPVARMVGQETSIEDQACLRASMGLDDPLPARYARFVGNLPRGEFGYSYRLRQPIDEMILSRLPATVERFFTAPESDYAREPLAEKPSLALPDGRA